MRKTFLTRNRFLLCPSTTTPHPSVTRMLENAKTLSENMEFGEAATRYNKIRTMPGFIPAIYAQYIPKMISVFSLADLNALQDLYLVDPNRLFYRNFVNPKTGSSSLHIALLSSLSLELAKELASKENIVLKNRLGYSPIHIAFRQDNGISYDFLEFLKEKFDLGENKMPFDDLMLSIMRNVSYPDMHTDELLKAFFNDPLLSTGCRFTRANYALKK